MVWSGSSRLKIQLKLIFLGGLLSKLNSEYQNCTFWKLSKRHLNVMKANRNRKQKHAKMIYEIKRRVLNLLSMKNKESKVSSTNKNPQSISWSQKKKSQVNHHIATVNWAANDPKYIVSNLKMKDLRIPKKDAAAIYEIS